MTGRSRAGWPAVALAVLALCASTPPVWFPGAGLLVLVGLGALYTVATRAARPYRGGYAVGLLHMLWFSWSLRHVTGPGYVAIGVLGAVYVVLAVAWTRAFARRPALAPLGFALGIAATAWLRAHMPELAYPHGQPAHALAAWPGLLGAAWWGGEELVNVLVAGAAAGLADLVLGGAATGAAAAGPGARRRGAVVLAVVGVTGAGLAVAGGATPPGDVLRVAALQSDYPRGFVRDPDGLAELATATRAVGRDHPDVELYLWPESTWPARVVGEPPRLERSPKPPIPAAAVLCAGTIWSAPDGRRAVAVLIDPAGRLLDLHEKRVSVPGGERVPFVHWLPDPLRERALDAFEGMIGFRPDQLHGRRRPPLRTPTGVPFAALTCFDNAFGRIAREAVADGARLLAVVSNESWYRQGGELDQMLAMTVIRALETGTPVVRSTVDGVTCVVHGDGRIAAEMPRAPGSGPAALVATVPLGPGQRPPSALGAPLTAAVALLPGAAVALHLLAGLRRRRARTRNGQGSQS